MEDLCDALVDMGGREYPVDPSNCPRQADGQFVLARAFFMPYWKGLPECELNDRPTALHVTVFPESLIAPATVTFKVFGSAGGRSTEIHLGAVRPDEALAFLPRAEAAGKAMWAAFVAHMTSEA